MSDRSLIGTTIGDSSKRRGTVIGFTGGERKNGHRRLVVDVQQMDDSWHVAERSGTSKWSDSEAYLSGKYLSMLGTVARPKN